MRINPKKMVQAVLVAKRHSLYEARIAEQTISGSAYLAQRRKEYYRQLTEAKTDAGQPKVKVVPFSNLAQAGAFRSLEATDADILLLTKDEALLTADAAEVTSAFFSYHGDCDIAYADEEQYLKPDWSPDTLLSFFYFGNVVAIRKSALSAVTDQLTAWEETEEGKRFEIKPIDAPDMIKRNLGAEVPYVTLPVEAVGYCRKLYQLVLTVIDHAGTAQHIEAALYSGEEEDTWGGEEVFADIKKEHRYSDPELPVQQPKVSVIILSKDNPSILSHCIHSLRECTAYRNIEIIVLDNGSNDKNKMLIEQMQNQLKPEYSFRYIHQPQPFNFSRLCNIGATYATGEYYLFMNDDAEAVREDWLDIMMKKALKSYVGAVGSKLLYPDRTSIQHAGVTNIHLGPAHKLQIGFNKLQHYHGWSHAAVNVSGVTGACLLMRKEVYEQTGGWNEELEVAFNDVELCFHLLDLGYMNVCCNQIHLLHHESISRGSDAGKKKLNRLHRERDLLYGLHPKMWNYDPYYNRAFETDMMDREFTLGNRFSEKRCSHRGVPERIDGQIDPLWHNEVLRSGIEFAGDGGLWNTGKAGEGDYYVQGWYYAMQVDNSRYEVSLILKKLDESQAEIEFTQDVTGELWKIPLKRIFRPDWNELLTTIDHPGLSGMSVWFDRAAIPEGEYMLGYLWEDTCSRQKMYDLTAETLRIVH